ncbi:hypothetical protein DFH28DRAFT_924428 [Melampsora americana]|nr:hypothetical protein DFH28DRAFT_924428 [Melampsora americana]
MTSCRLYVTHCLWAVFPLTCIRRVIALQQVPKCPPGQGPSKPWTIGAVHTMNTQASKKNAEEKEQLGLGRLIVLEEEIQQLWNSLIPTAKYESLQARSLNELQEEIRIQQKKFGAEDVLAWLTSLWQPNFINAEAIQPLLDHPTLSCINPQPATLWLSI